VQAWLELGGAYAEANLRGAESTARPGTGGDAGQQEHVFDDFTAAAEYLISEHYTRSARLGIHGAAATADPHRRGPDAAPGAVGAALPAVGVLDMLRTTTASATPAWSSDYGLAEDPEQFKAL